MKENIKKKKIKTIQKRHNRGSITREKLYQPPYQDTHIQEPAIVDVYPKGLLDRESTII